MEFRSQESVFYLDQFLTIYRSVANDARESSRPRQSYLRALNLATHCAQKVTRSRKAKSEVIGNWMFENRLLLCSVLELRAVKYHIGVK
ncbi:hypothetical protein EVAR_3837_1 [Eumeta japonica]|uniref:Uncharacterized protein n=1 Tax=Eumeta variegata TaxID=151549 RepID=A0A4C1SR55_EUMVA|nr:hypothetical protein EVAR_3837_1 [Eumeta japonica]